MIKNELISTDYKTSDFYYDLPKELIAQTPEKQRDMSRLMLINREKKEISHKIFHDIVDYLREGDVLVINNSKVIPARIYGKKDGTEGLVEMLLLRRRGEDLWEVLVRPGRRIRLDTVVTFDNGLLSAKITENLPDGNRLVKFTYDKSRNFLDIIEKIGQMPLPPYITKKLADKSRYQTVYAKYEGSAAAPTAGFHFTNELIEKIKEKNVLFAPVTLHVGLGTFRPVKVENISEHIMHTEYFMIDKTSADIINNAKKNKNRVIAVGTTSCRVLESVADENGFVHETADDTGIFIYPPYKFKCVDAMITNFHLPESTLLMLVCAFADKDLIFKAYNEAIKEKYRFFSFGDAMFIQ